ncbi:MAG: TetR/AcrR family transcriptional regulator [Dethiobacter sp.]|nr:TetR/AcrR family transcriptional regulator [Dethiobacter sp.]MBS3899218.1 TetR/AcrR family transcriptional regulator [Dethiobacter sp.]MBS3948481.1 TetR/AcrR family transcriptional regulator [Dethiobacter sp.]
MPVTKVTWVISVGGWLPASRWNEGVMMQEISEKKARILAAAMDIFGERPYDQVKIEDIAERAGVGKGTIYEYFVSKEDLFAAGLEAGFNEYFMALVAAAVPSLPATAKLQAVFGRHLSFISQHAAATRIIIGERPASRSEMREAMVGRYMRLGRFLEELLQEGIAAGDFRPVDTAVVAQAIIGMFSTLLVFVLFAGQAADAMEKQAEKLLDFCLLGLAS